MRWLMVLVLLLGGTSLAMADEVDDRLARELVSVVRDPRLPVRQRVAAAQTLGKLGPKSAAAVPELIAQLGRLRGAELESLQEAVVEALGRIGPPAREALPALARASGRSLDIDLAIRRARDRLITTADSPEVGLLLEQLESRDSSIRLRAAKALRELGPVAREAVPSLLAVLSDPDGDVRRAAMAALRAIQPESKLTEEFARAYALDLKDPDAGIRLLAARQLGRMGRTAAPILADLEAALSDPDPDVRRAVAEALTRIGAP